MNGRQAPGRKSVTGLRGLLQKAQNDLRSGRLDDAERMCRELIKKYSKNADVIYLFGSVLYAKGHYKEACRQFSKCVRIKPGDLRYLAKLGNAQAALGEYDRAIATYDKALARDKYYLPVLAGKADALDRRGEKIKAFELLDSVVQKKQEDANVAYVYAGLALRMGKSELAVETASRYVNDPGNTPTARRRLLLTLARACEKNRQYADALKYAAEAHKILRQPFNKQAHKNRLEHVINAFSSDRIAKLSHSGNNTTLPVFIVGMPRCGSTLCEQIIAAHPLAHGAGELPYFPDLVTRVLRDFNIDNFTRQAVKTLTKDKLGKYASVYLSQLREENRTAQRIVDKMLYNYEHLGLISLLFPKSRIIYMHRDPVDTCLSCYLQTLSPHSHPYIASLDNLAFVYRNHEKMMTYWQEVLGDMILRVEYEELVENQDEISRRIIAFLGLPWDEKCLQFHQTAGQTRTVSYDQVRQPIYRSSIRRADGFGNLLAPLREALQRYDENME